ncbi:MAG: sugar dehydrogenase complex small subunit [Actinomycetota bacterium]
MNRRTFLAIAGVTTAGIYLAGCGFSSTPVQPSTLQVARFTEVSQVLTGFAGALPEAPAARYYTALTALGLECSPADFLAATYRYYGPPNNMAELRARGALALPGADAFVRHVNAAWWSGTVPMPDGGLEVVTYRDALAFHVVHPATECLGATGAWSEPGAAAA